jgi:hypothetical protein
MSQEHDPSNPDDAHASGGIHTEPPPFEHGYQPESLPKISVPDLSPDAQGLTAEALAQVPTLTELVVDEPLVEAVVPTPEAEPAVDTPIQNTPIQDTPVEADTWTEVLHARMGKLTGDIQTLNTRLDRLEERNKTKV